ncbi:MAG: arginine deiminase-related protein, partial [Steroidobacteraceae bacterium]
MKPMLEPDRQCAAAVLMIRPARFGANPETAPSNRFQQGGATEDAPLAARREFDGLVAQLADSGVAVHVVDDTPEPARPDACFPNNWVSFHDDGSVVLYPLLAASRRPERRADAIGVLQRAGYRIAKTVDLTGWEERGEFLEGTGSLVLDRCHRIAYACWSPRTTPAALADFAARLGYRVVSFDARDPGGQAIYHTNVMMAIGERFSVLCADAIPDPAQRAAVMRELEESGHEPIVISVAEMNGFAGNL